MNTFKIIVAGLLIFLLFFAGCMVQVVSTAPVGAQYIEPSTLQNIGPSTFQLISLAILGIYEVVVRAVPSVGNYSAVSWLISALKFVSDKLNATK